MHFILLLYIVKKFKDHLERKDSITVSQKFMIEKSPVPYFPSCTHVHLIQHNIEYVCSVFL